MGSNCRCRYCRVQIERVLSEEIMEAFKHSKIGQAPWPSDIYAEMILAIVDAGIRVLMKLCHGILDGK